MKGRALLCLCVVGCGGEAPTSPPSSPPEPAPPQPKPDLTAPYFAPDRLLEIEIEMAESDWDALRSQSRDFIDLFAGEDCLAEPFESPFTYFAGAVTIDGERIEDVGIRKKGFIGSLDEVRPSLKLKFDELVPGREFSGFERMTLNNVRQDPSAIKQCLAYGLYRQAGVIAPRCNFAHVTVNGRDLGIYAHVDAIKKRFLRRHFADDEGDLWEGTVSDFRDGWLGTFQQKTDREIPASKDRLFALSAALGRTDAELAGALEAHVILDDFLVYWAIESIVVHWDGYAGNTNNFYLYDDPTSERLHFIAWGVDAAFAEETPNPMTGPQPIAFLQSRLAHRLYGTDEGRARFVDAAQAVLDQVWNETDILDEIDRMESLIAGRATHRPDLSTSIDAVRDFVRGRRATVEADLDMGGRPSTQPLRDTICLVDRGDLTVDLETTWGTLGQPNPFETGTSTTIGSVDGNAITDLAPGGAVAGINPEGRALLASITVVSATPSFLLTVIGMPPDRVAPGIQAIDRRIVDGAILFIPSPGAEAQLAGYLGQGTVEILEGSSAAGTPIRARIDATVF